MDIASSPQVKWGLKALSDTLIEAGKSETSLGLSFETKECALPNRYNEQGYAVETKGNAIVIGASQPVGALYALMDLVERIRCNKEIPSSWCDAPCMKYRGYTLGLQKQTRYYPDHKYYDWPINRENFPWFYDKDHMTKVLDTLAFHRCNMLTLWSGHPFASFLKLEDYPEMPEVGDQQLWENQGHLDWLADEAQTRGIQLFLHFYNIHMPDPLAKARNWNPLEGKAHEEICDYTRKVLKAFVERFPQIGLAACIGEVLDKNDKGKWLEHVILRGILEGVKDSYPPLILRAHGFEVQEYLEQAERIYPNLITMHKHNNENLISHRPEPENIALAKVSPCHIISVHLCANLEPFSWGSPTFIRNTVEQMIRQNAGGVNVYPLRFWDWPNSSHVTPAGDQLYEHFIWWSAWGRYAWNPWREEDEETALWTQELSRHYGIASDAAATLLLALETTGETLPEIASQFMISTGNRQSIALGQFIVPLAFTRLQYHGGSGYSMSQLCGFPLIGERMWSLSPLERMETQTIKCRKALSLIESLMDTPADTPFIRLIQREIEVLYLLAKYYRFKAKASAEYFRVLYKAPHSTDAKACFDLEHSLSIYREIAEKTRDLFRDAGGLYLFREIPLPAEEGYLHWTDCLPAFENELFIAQAGGIDGLLEAANKTRWKDSSG